MLSQELTVEPPYSERVITGGAEPDGADVLAVTKSPAPILIVPQKAMEPYTLVWSVIITAVVIVSIVRAFRVGRELSRLRVIAGEFTESDIDTVFRHALSLERSGSREQALRLFQLVATHSTDPESVRLARESMHRMNRQTR